MRNGTEHKYVKYTVMSNYLSDSYARVQSGYFLNKKLGVSGALLLFVVSIIALVGCLLLYSAAGKDENLRNLWAMRQFYVYIILISIAAFTSFLSIKVVYSASYHIYWLCFILLGMANISGYAAMGAQRWLHIGMLNLQPSEFMKVAVIMALARYFQRLHNSNIDQYQSLIIPILIVVAPAIVIFKQPNLGSAIVVVLIGCCMFFAAGVSLRKFAFGGIFILIFLPITWYFLLHDYQKRRILTFLNPGTDLLSSGYNVVQSKIAIGSGGFWGKGFAHGTQSQLKFLPEKHTDFLFSILSEELGLVAVLGMLLLYAILILLCYVISMKSHNHYGRMVTIGAASFIFIQVAINLAMISGLVPVVGIPLPFVSYGGSSLSSCIIAIALVLNARAHMYTTI